MTEYECLLQYADDVGVEVIERKCSIKGLYSDNIIQLSTYIKTSKEKCCILAEEIGHHETSQGNILDYSNLNNMKQEVTARNWAVDKIVTVRSLIDAFNVGVRNRYELSEYLDITEEFIDYSIARLSQKHGQFVVEGDYVVYFVPNLAILRINEQ